MADASSQAVAELLTVEMDQDAPALVGVVEVVGVPWGSLPDCTLS
jgi:hypothetical protein